jgi:hypothetical protein
MALNNEEKNNKNELSLGQNDFVCGNCGYVVEPVKVVRGNLATEIILWFFFLIPGLCYSVWRVGGKDMVCPSCNSSQIIPIDSPKGKEMAKKAVKFSKPNKSIWQKPWFWVVIGVIFFVVLGSITSGN